MLTTLPTSETARRIEEQFLDLIYADTDLLSAEFDAIIAVEWPEPPAEGPAPGVAGGRPRRGASRRAPTPFRGPVSWPRHPGIGEWARSPPLRHPTHYRQKGR